MMLKLRSAPVAIRLAARIETLPAGVWPAAQCIALHPTWLWAAARMTDGSDDPLGIAAAALLGVALWQLRRQMRLAPQPGWRAAAMASTLATTAAYLALPPLACAVLAALSLGCGIAAFLPQRTAAAPFFGLTLLALPVLSSLQFYAGFPLRVITAELSTWLLRAAGSDAVRSGTAMVVNGRLVIVDAPCSGVQMVWMAYCTACAVALFCGLASRRFFRRLPLVGAVVLAGNVLRNAVLVTLEAHGAPPAWLHDAIGLAVLAAVCAAVCLIMKGAGHAHSHR
jgi:exosortase/archaeosortase family protein